MFRTLTIKNFRGFQELELSGLGRVNLLVGTNNSGKTSVLEALQFVARGGDMGALMAALTRRAERSLPLNDAARPMAALDVRYLFHMRSLDGQPIALGADTADGARVNFTVSTSQVPIDDEEQLHLWRRLTSRSSRYRRELTTRPTTDDEVDIVDRVPRFLEVRAGDEVIGRAPLQFGGALFEEEAMSVGTAKAPSSVQFIGTSSLSQASLARLYDRVVLTDEEPGVVLALNAVEDAITKIAAVERGDPRFAGTGRGIVVGLRGASEPVPLGSLGDGMSRMLGIALSLVAARDGYLLIDEIDTGLHHTVMRKMWRLVFETAKRLNVCVYATTHSYDCVHALATIANPETRDAGEVSLIRVDRHLSHGVSFSEREISLLAEREIEPR
jgi:hypothetical protein